MNGHSSKALRLLLRAKPDGMSVTELSNHFGITPDGVRKALKHMPDTYIARWERAANGRMMSVWCVVVPPPDAVNPEVFDMPHLYAHKPAPRRPAPPKAAPAPRNHKPQGITEIRGPWPSFH
jgi:hypothetical protein